MGNAIVDKSKIFAIHIVNFVKDIQNEKHEFIMSKQLLRSGTSIGANAKEAIRAVSKSDFYNKLNISLKEASETEYWLELLHECDYVDDGAFNGIYSECQELIKILMAITKTQNN
ncbi:MAG: four helix bundle protein [Clostridiales bacterium]|nr:four helix bundle protein [Clostridiales bacterium]